MEREPTISEAILIRSGLWELNDIFEDMEEKGVEKEERL